MYRQPMTSSVPGESTVNVKPVRSANSRACRSRSPRLASSDMPSTGGRPQDSKPGVARMCAMLDVHAAWSDSLCCAPSATRWNPSTLKAAPGIVYRLASRYQLSIHVGGTARWHRYVPLATPFACQEHSGAPTTSAAMRDMEHSGWTHRAAPSAAEQQWSYARPEMGIG